MGGAQEFLVHPYYGMAKSYALRHPTTPLSPPLYHLHPRACVVFCQFVGSQIQTATLSALLVDLATLLAERDAKLAAANDFVKNRYNQPRSEPDGFRQL